MEHLARYLALSLVPFINNIEIREWSKPNYFQSNAENHKKVLINNVNLPDLRGCTPLPPNINPPVKVAKIIFLTLARLALEGTSQSPFQSYGILQLPWMVNEEKPVV